MSYSAGRRHQRQFASLHRKEWERKRCNPNCLDSCWDIQGSPRCCLQLVSNLERKWKWKENDIKMAIASATYNSQFSCSDVRTTEIVDELPSSLFEIVSTSWKQRHVQPWGLAILMAGKHNVKYRAACECFVFCEVLQNGVMERTAQDWRFVNVQFITSLESSSVQEVLSREA